jgi:cardiolipin synthase
VLLLAEASAAAAPVAGPIGWALAWWGIVLYWIAGLFYVYQVVQIARANRPTR